MENYPKKKAIEIVEDYLKLNKFIESNKENIIQHLKEFAEQKDALLCESKEIPEGIKFLSQTLPFMSGIINVGAKPSDFGLAKNEICEIYKKENGEHPHGSIIYIFSVYTFIYIIEKIVDEEKLRDFLRKQAVWLCNMPVPESI